MGSCKLGFVHFAAPEMKKPGPRVRQARAVPLSDTPSLQSESILKHRAKSGARSDSRQNKNIGYWRNLT